jgi:hypothetical protein
MEKLLKAPNIADQSVVTLAGILTNLDTIIEGITFALDYYVIDLAIPSTYPILLGGSWLYTAKMHVNWNEKKISFERLRVHLNWAIIKYEGEIESTNEGYTLNESNNFMEGNMPISYLILSSVESLNEKADEDSHLAQQNQQPTPSDHLAQQNQQPTPSDLVIFGNEEIIFENEEGNLKMHLSLPE